MAVVASAGGIPIQELDMVWWWASGVQHWLTLFNWFPRRSWFSHPVPRWIDQKADVWISRKEGWTQ